MEASNLVFLSYASPDLDEVETYYDFLKGLGFDVWLDKRRLKGGQNWDFEIKKALQNSAVIVVFVSKNSVDRRGYVQREIKIALEHAEKKLIDDIFIIPVMLDDTSDIPEQLQDRHAIWANHSQSKDALAEAIRDQLEKIGVKTDRFQGEADLHWSISSYSDTWDGLPGYEANFQILKFQSDTYKNAFEITDVIRGWITAQSMENRMVKFEQNSEYYDFGQDRYMRQNSWEASAAQPRLKNRVLTIPYSIYWYSAGAAHPNHGYKTFCFTLDPLTQIASLQSIFTNPDAALAIIRTEARAQLMSLRFGEEEGQESGEEAGGYGLDLEWVERGTEDWESFHAFVFEEDGIEIIFPPYQVAAYAYGMQFVKISYEKLSAIVHKHYRFALGIQYFSISS